MNIYKQFLPNYEITEMTESDYLSKTFKISTQNSVNTFYRKLKVVSIPNEILINDFIEQTNKKNFEEIIQYFEETLKQIVLDLNNLHNLRQDFNNINYFKHYIIKQSSKIGWDILLIMENSNSLENIILTKKLTISDIIKIGIDISTILITCKKNNLIHGSIYENNIYFSKDGRYKLGNFFIEKNLISQSLDSFYFPPNSTEKSYHTDLYSLGITLYKLLNNNRFPFFPKHPSSISVSDIEIAKNHLLSNEPFELPCDAHQLLGNVILKACDISSTPESFRDELLIVQNCLRIEDLERNISLDTSTKYLETINLYNKKKLKLINYSNNPNKSNTNIINISEIISSIEYDTGDTNSYEAINSHNGFNFEKEITLQEIEVPIEENINNSILKFDEPEFIEKSEQDNLNTILLEELKTKKHNNFKIISFIAASIIILFIFISYYINKPQKNNTEIVLINSSTTLSIITNTPSELVTSPTIEPTPTVTVSPSFDLSLLKLSSSSTNIKENSFTLTLKDTGTNIDDISKVYFNIRSPLDSKNDTSWKSNGVAKYNSNLKQWNYQAYISDHGFENGKYIAEAYVQTKNSEFKFVNSIQLDVSRTASIIFDKSPIKFTDFNIGVKNACISNKKLSSIKLKSWTNKDGKDDLVTSDAVYNKDNDLWSKKINISSHNFQTGEYFVEVFAEESKSKELVSLGTVKFDINLDPSKSISLENNAIYKIYNQNSNLLLTNNNNLLVQQSNTSSVNQQWKVTSVNQSYKLQSMSNNLFLDIEPTSDKLLLNANNSIWNLSNTGTLFCSVFSITNGKALTVKNNSKTSGAEVIQAFYSNNDSQKWFFEKIN